MADDSLNHLTATRRANLRRLAGAHGSGVLAQRLGYTTGSYISQMIGPNPVRPVTERTARVIEQVLGLEPGWLDLDLEVLETET